MTHTEKSLLNLSNMQAPSQNWSCHTSAQEHSHCSIATFHFYRAVSLAVKKKKKNHPSGEIHLNYIDINENILSIKADRSAVIQKVC